MGEIEQRAFKQPPTLEQRLLGSAFIEKKAFGNTFRVVRKIGGER